MSLASMMVHDVTIVHASTAIDRYGNTTKNWAAATRTDKKGWVAQRDRSEVLDNREAQVSLWVLFLPEDAVIVGGDRVEWNDPDPIATFEVDGPPNQAWTPRGEHHIEADLTVVEG